jgi:hypothetical protein
MVKLANEQIDKLVPDGCRHTERPEPRLLDGVRRLQGAAGQPAVDTRHSGLRRQLVPAPVAGTRGDNTRLVVRTYGINVGGTHGMGGNNFKSRPHHHVTSPNFNWSLMFGTSPDGNPW